MESPLKRRRLSFHSAASSGLADAKERYKGATRASGLDKPRKEADEDEIAISSTSKLVGKKTVAPFLSHHIPEQYAPLGIQAQAKKSQNADPNSRYCYRHRPDLKCRRQVDEPSMDQLQSELASLSQNDQQAITHVWTLFSAAPAKQRHLMLQGILTQCCFPQLSYLSSQVKELVKIDFLSALPTELSFEILRSLDTISLCKAAQVSQRWRTLADDDVVWHKMCEQHIDRKCTKCGWGLPLLDKQRLRACKRSIQLRAEGKSLPVAEATDQVSQRYPSGGSLLPSSPLPSGSLTPNIRPWKDIYKDRFKVGCNWKHGRYFTKTFHGHTNGVMCLQFDDHTLMTGSYDATIKVWSLETTKEQKTLTGHAEGVRALQFDDSKIVSGSMDHTIKIWNRGTGECVRTLRGHTGGVVALHFVGSLLASGGTDNAICIWNLKEKSISTLRGHSDWVNSVKIDLPSRTLFSASDDLTVKLWDLDSKSIIRTFKGHAGQVQQILPLPHDFELEHNDTVSSTQDSDSHDDTVSSVPGQDDVPGSLYDVTSQSAASTANYSPCFLTSRQSLPPRYMLTAALDSTIRLWDVTTGQCLRTFFGHVEGVWALAADSLRIVTGSQDKTTKIWDVRSGKCEKTYTGHNGPVTCIGLSDSRMATGSEDGVVRLYSFRNEGEEEKVRAGVQNVHVS